MRQVWNLDNVCSYALLFMCIYSLFLIRAMTLYANNKLCCLLLVRTSPPGNLRGALEKDKLCLQWEAPLLSVFAHLQYEVGYQTKEGEGWMVRCSLQWSFTHCIHLICVSFYQITLKFFCVNICGRILCQYSTL